jgi:hypothetical protein
VHRRFQIEDLIIQDASGVVFRALDTKTGRPVALRRFFPFGANGGGLLDEEQTAYNIALGRLAGLNHLALRSVISGGCDPVDGIPFIATEWIEGDLLEPILQRGPLPAEAAAELITQALEVCELLSRVLAEEAVWVETDPQTIVLGNAESGRGFTFWISPLKWLGGSEESRGMRSIIELTEQIMGWQGMVVNDQAGGGLGAWLKWLRGAKNTTLREVRENLAAAIGSEPPATANQLVLQATRPPARKSSKVAVLGGLGLALVLTGLSGWLITRNPAAQAMTGIEAPPSRVAEVNQRAGELSELAMQANREQAGILAAQQAALDQQGGVFSIKQGDLLALQKGQSVRLGGRIEKIESSQSGATLYLYFSQEPAANEPRASVLLKSAPDLDRPALELFVGKEVSLSGKVTLERGRPQVILTKRSDIQLME